jgi:hypothetical protein
MDGTRSINEGMGKSVIILPEKHEAKMIWDIWHRYKVK